MKTTNTTISDQCIVTSTDLKPIFDNIKITSRYAYWQRQGVEFGNFDQPNSIFNFDPETGKFGPTWEEIEADAVAEAERMCPKLFQKRDDGDDDLLFKEDENGQYDAPARPIIDCYDEPRWF